MRKSSRRFVMLAVVGLSVLALSQTSAHAQFYPRPTVLPRRPVPRVTVTVPSVRSYTNPYVLPGMTLNQFAFLDVLSMGPGVPSSVYSYYNPYVTPYPAVNPYLTPGVSVTTTYTPRYPVTGVPYNPYNLYNPYFAAYGLYP
jgi:hypothetical protein